MTVLSPTAGCLSSSTIELRTVFEEVQEVVDWMPFGVFLKLELSQLKRIEQEYSESKRRLLEMLGTWLKLFPDASWIDIVKALQSIDHKVLAQRIEEKYISKPITDEIVAGRS